MSAGTIIRAIDAHAAQSPHATALRSVDSEISYVELALLIRRTAGLLKTRAPRVIGLAADNGPAWAVADLGAMAAAIPVVPLPFFFSPGQLLNAIVDAGIDCVLTDQPDLFADLLVRHGIDVESRIEHDLHGHVLTELRLQGLPAARLPDGTAKVTYTSGTTGNPKGVCLGLEAIERVAKSLQQATAATAGDRHVCLLPLSTLLENIAGLYVPLLAGAACTLLACSEVGLKGASGLDVQKMAGVLFAHAATTTILTPEMLRALVAAVVAGYAVSPSLRLVAVGGAPVAGRLLEQARATGIPVYEGYGLSECASVVAFNAPDANRPGSVGRLLPHASLDFAEDGEILVGGAILLGYTGESSMDVVADSFWPTGDLGYLDAEGFLHITGRKKNIFITSFGRNVAPEWVERELTLYPCIAQAAVFGEAKPWNVAVIVPRGQGDGLAGEIDRAIAEANSNLPDYARARRWIRADAPFTPQGGQLTSNGRLRREAIHAAYRDQIEHLYGENADVVL